MGGNPRDPHSCPWKNSMMGAVGHQEPCQWGTDPHNGAHRCQQFLTDQGSLEADLVLPFPLNDGVSRHLAATFKQQSRVNPGDGQNPTDPVDGQTHNHGYNTRSKSKVENVVQGGDIQEKLSRVALKKMERNPDGLSHTPAELQKKHLDDPDIGPVLQWKESGTRPFGPEACTASTATRYYWNSCNMLQIKKGLLMRHFARHDVTQDHLQFLVPRTIHRDFKTCSQFPTLGTPGSKKD